MMFVKAYSLSLGSFTSAGNVCRTFLRESLIG